MRHTDFSAAFTLYPYFSSPLPNWYNQTNFLLTLKNLKVFFMSQMSH